MVSPSISWAKGKDSTDEQASRKKMDSRVTMWRKDKAPYGTYYAYEYLNYMFPEAEILVYKNPPGENNLFARRKFDDIANKINLYKGKVAQVIISPIVEPDEVELEALMSFVFDGNCVFISSYNIGELLLKKIGVSTYYNGGWADFDDSLEVQLVHPISYETELFSYPGARFDNSFVQYDSNTTTILGRNWSNRKPNFIRIDYTGGGSVYLHLAPLCFSNFFLLHKSNKTYYDKVMSYIPSDTKLITWSEYFRTKEESNSTGRAFSFMKKHPPLAAALWLMLLMFLLIFLFESKRKQRLVPIRSPLRNTSLDFVKTIGQLYYQRHDNKNLSGKMTAHFLDYVRTKYNLSTSKMDEEFKKKLAYKAGIQFNIVHDIVYHANYLNDQYAVSDADLLLYNNQLQNFYKKA